jgi:hypothetical protein
VHDIVKNPHTGLLSQVLKYRISPAIDRRDAISLESADDDRRR